MAAAAESSEAPPNPPPPIDHPITYDSKTLDPIITPWIEYAVHQTQLAQKTIQDAVDSAVEASRTRLTQIRDTSSAHFNQTLDSLQDIKSEYSVYEDLAFEKIKEGVLIAASRPMITGSVAVGLGFLVFKRPRRFLYYKSLNLFASEERLLSKADAKVKELRQSIDLLKAESEKLERRASMAEEEMMRGRTKLRQAGNQIQGVIRSAYKIERQAGGLKDILKELPTREASRFRSQVSNLASEAKRERNALNKEVSKICNYGISV